MRIKVYKAKENGKPGEIEFVGWRDEATGQLFRESDNAPRSKAAEEREFKELVEAFKRTGLTQKQAEIAARGHA